MSATLSSATFQIFAELLYARSGLALGPDKVYLLEARLAPILRREKLCDLAALAVRLRVPRDGLRTGETLEREVVEAMTTGESLFFRDGAPFNHLRTRALPDLLASRPPGAVIRIWSAAASAGQEAYSLAMIVTDGFPRDRRIEIVGTDIARGAIARAREGLYSQFEVQRGLPVQMLMKHFRKEDGGNWRIAPGPRSMVTFRQWNLLDDLTPLGRFDVVFCRNVLIYFDAPTKSRVLDAIAARMADDGLLYLGGAETVVGLTKRFAPTPEERGVYTKTVAARTAP